MYIEKRTQESLDAEFTSKMDNELSPAALYWIRDYTQSRIMKDRNLTQSVVRYLIGLHLPCEECGDEVLVTSRESRKVTNGDWFAKKKECLSCKEKDKDKNKESKDPFSKTQYSFVRPSRLLFLANLKESHRLYEDNKEFIEAFDKFKKRRESITKKPLNIYLKTVQAEVYKLYLKTGYFDSVKEEVKKRAGGRCILNNTLSNNQVHHRTYAHLGDFEKEVSSCDYIGKNAHAAIHHQKEDPSCSIKLLDPKEVYKKFISGDLDDDYPVLKKKKDMTFNEFILEFVECGGLSS